MGLLRLVFQPILLHRYLGVAQQILLLSEFSFGIQNLKVEVAVRKTGYHIALLDVRAFLNHLFHHDTTFFWRNLNDLDGQHLPVGAHIVLKLSTLHVADGQLVLVHFEC